MRNVTPLVLGPQDPVEVFVKCSTSRDLTYVKLNLAPFGTWFRALKFFVRLNL